MPGQARRHPSAFRPSDFEKPKSERPDWMRDPKLLPKEPPGGKKKRGASMPPPKALPLPPDDEFRRRVVTRGLTGEEEK
jgi:hypothetical protein